MNDEEFNDAFYGEDGLYDKMCAQCDMHIEAQRDVGEDYYKAVIFSAYDNDSLHNPLGDVAIEGKVQLRCRMQYFFGEIGRASYRERV